MGLREDIHTDPVSELDVRELLWVRPGTTVRQCLALMRSKHLGCVIVVNEAGQPVGKFTERLLMKLVLRDASGLDKPVDGFMYKDANVIAQRDPIEKLLRTMQKQSLRFMCVVDDTGKAVGLTGQKGLMEYVTEHFPRQVKGQRMRSKMYMDEREGA